MSSKSISNSTAGGTSSSSTTSTSASIVGAGNSVSMIACNAASTEASDSLRKPAANWCSNLRISSAALVKACANAGLPCWCNCTCNKACSSARAISDNAVKPTVAELPNKECAKTTTESGNGSWSSNAHSLNSICKRRDHSSASLR